MSIPETNTKTPGYAIVDFAELPGQNCPCGVTRRAFLEECDLPLSVHRVEIADDARLHYHRRLTETYYILECDADAAIELDDRRVPVRPGSCVVIYPGTRHRAVGRMTVLNVVTPKFDPADEWFD